VLTAEKHPRVTRTAARDKGIGVPPLGTNDETVRRAEGVGQGLNARPEQRIGPPMVVPVGEHPCLPDTRPADSRMSGGKRALRRHYGLSGEPEPVRLGQVPGLVDDAGPDGKMQDFTF